MSPVLNLRIPWDGSLGRIEGGSKEKREKKREREENKKRRRNKKKRRERKHVCLNSSYIETLLYSVNILLSFFPLRRSHSSSRTSQANITYLHLLDHLFYQWTSDDS